MDDNVVLIDLKTVCYVTIVDTQNKLREFDITSINLKDKFHKKIFYHYYIYNIAKLVLSLGKYKCVMYLNCDVKYRDLLLRINNTIGKYFPFIFLYSDISYKKYIKKLEIEGNKYEFLNFVSSSVQKLQKRKMPFYKIKYFCKKYDLKFLDEVYFNNLYNVVNLVK